MNRTDSWRAIFFNMFIFCTPSSSRDLGKNDAQWAAYAFTETRHDLALAIYSMLSNAPLTREVKDSATLHSSTWKLEQPLRFQSLGGFTRHVAGELTINVGRSLAIANWAVVLPGFWRCKKSRNS